MISRLRASFSHAPRTLALVARAWPAGAAALAALAIAGAALPPAVAWAGKRIVDAAVARDPDAAFRWVLVELALAAAVALCHRGLTLLRAVLGARLGVDVNVMILEKAATLELRHFEDPDFYDRLTRARREASSRPISVVVETAQIAQNTLQLVAFAALLARFSPLAVLLLALATVPATIAEVRFSDVGFRLRNWRAPEARRLTYLEYVLANDGHAKEVKTLGIGPLLLGRYKAIAEGIFREDRSLATKRSLWGYALSLLATGTFYACHAYLAVAAARGALSLGDLALYVVAFRQGQGALQAVLTALGGMYEDNLYMSNLFSFLALDPSASGDAIAPRAAGDAIAPHAAGDATPPSAAGDVIAVGDAVKSTDLERSSGLRLVDVGYRYPGQPGWALRGVTLEIPPGQSLALVGQNGSGKSTLIKLLTRLYEPTEGAIYLDGVDLRAWDAQALRARVGVVFQDFNRYQLSLRENVGVGSVAHLDDAARVERALESGGATDVVAGLAQGLETPLGRWFRNEGVELSGGQWQRIAISRAFMREEADILVLDEPTAALDAEAEAAVYERFRALAKGRTAILVSHRFPTVRHADRIVVLAAGQIVEQGAHDDLVALDGRYARLFKLQAAGYL